MTAATKVALAALSVGSLLELSACTPAPPEKLAATCMKVGELELNGTWATEGALWRCESQEAVCYVGRKGGVQCLWKEPPP